MIALLLTLAPAHATWSIAAVDPETQEVGIAGATCGPFVWGIAGVAPGAGVVAAQYDTWTAGRDLAVEALEAGDSAEEALQAVLDADEDDGWRQWAVVGFDGVPAGFTGDEVEAPALIEAGETWSAQGNTLASEEVVRATAASFASSEGGLAARLVAALAAGAGEGGDHRCDPEDAAKSAFVYVAAPDDGREPSTELRASGKGAVDELVARFAEGDRSCATGPGGGALAVLVAVGALFGRRRSGRG